MREFINITSALADESRVKALLALQGRELCACQIVEFLDLAPSTVSKHMSLLKQARLVESRKDGRWIYYRLAGDKASSLVQESQAWVFRALSKDPELKDEMKKLQKILKTDRETLCKIQRGK
jgi:DNA-binding transcriptional ArsR family regulator